jgi:hypothetical protein
MSIKIFLFNLKFIFTLTKKMTCGKGEIRETGEGLRDRGRPWISQLKYIENASPSCEMFPMFNQG